MYPIHSTQNLTFDLVMLFKYKKKKEKFGKCDNVFIVNLKDHETENSIFNRRIELYTKNKQFW